MAFVNECIPKADYEKYELRRIIGEENPFEPGYLFAREWTIDREQDLFFVKIWTHREAEFDGYAFHWKGEWMFFEMRPAGHTYDQARNAISFRFLVKGFGVPDRVKAHHEEVMSDLQAAITASLGGMTHNYAHRSATFEFV